MQRFFASGYPKSGTTFLQMLLDAHPAINCPSEQNLAFLVNSLLKFSLDYRKVISGMDERTGGQGTRFDGKLFFAGMARSAIVTLMESGATEATTHVGVNDNMMTSHGKMLAGIMPRARFIFILRDPRAVGVSLWHHKLRTEPSFARQNPPMEVTLEFVSTSWPEHVRDVQAFIKERPTRCHLVRYEDLLGAERDRHLATMLEFLEAPAEPAILQAMWDATEFDKLRERELAKDGEKAGFFRAGKTDAWREQAPPEAIARFTDAVAEAMELVGYEVTR